MNIGQSILTRMEWNMKEKFLPQEKRTRCEVWTRVMGYHRPVHNFNAGKQAEFRERKYFRETANWGQIVPENRLQIVNK